MTKLLPGLWRSDPAHSTFLFTAPHRGLSRIRGSFKKFNVEIRVAEDGAWSRCAFEVSANSVDTNDAERDNIIRSLDYFDVKTYPTLDYEADDITPEGDGLVVSGELAVNGTSHTVEFFVTVAGPVNSPDAPTRAGIAATGRISRSAFGLRTATHPLTMAQPDADLIAVSLELEITQREP